MWKIGSAYNVTNDLIVTKYPHLSGKLAGPVEIHIFSLFAEHSKGHFFRFSLFIQLEFQIVYVVK